MTPPREHQFLDVSGILEPKSVAVIGASDRPGSFGGETVRRLIKFGFPGPVWGVNRNQAVVEGRKCLPNVSALPAVPDLAILAVPAEALIGAVEECADHGIRFGIAYAGGLAEAGGDGTLLQEQLTAACRRTGFNLCGPNCVGVINASLPATSTFSTALFELETLQPGSVSIVAQSGGIATGALSMIQEAGFGTRYMISSGNEAVVSFSDYVYALARDPGTRVIAGYLEGVSDGDKFVHALEEARSMEKPVVLIKAGTTGASAQAAQAHTGALVGENRVFDAVFNELGVVRVSSLEELVDVSLTLVSTAIEPRPLGNVGIVTFGGGNGVLAADQCASHGLGTPALSAGTVEELSPLLVSVATAANPVDLTPTTAFRPESLAQLPKALDVVARDPSVDSLLLIAGSLASRATEISDVMLGLVRRAAKPVFVCWPSPPNGVVERFAAESIFAFQDTGRAVRTIRAIEARATAAARPAQSAEPASPAFDWTGATGPDAPRIVSEPECHRILEAAGLSVATGRLVDSEEAALEAALAIGLPVAVKGISDKVTHRAAAGLVALGVASGEEVREAFRRIHQRAVKNSGALEGVYVQAMHPGRFEMLVTAFRDPLFGPMVTCGAGGAWTEIADDVVTERAPVSAELAAHMMGRLRAFRRGNGPAKTVDCDAAAKFVARFSELAANAPWDQFVFEINPLSLNRDEAVAVDGLLVIG